MTVSTINNAIYFTGNGVTVEFPFDFQILDESHVFVYLNDVLQSDGFSIVSNPDQQSSPGGTITFLVAPESDSKVAVIREVPATQEVDYAPFDPFPAETHEGALDKLTMLIQEKGDESDRHFGFASSVPDVQSTKLTETVGDRSNKVLSFDTEGNLVLLDRSLAGTVPVVYTESQELDDGQTEVTFINSVSRSSVHINGDNTDSQRLLLNLDYKFDTSERTVTLTQSYPQGTIITLAYNDVGENTPVGYSKTFETVGDAKSYGGIVGELFRTKGYYAAGDGGGATYLVAASQTVDGFGDHVMANGNVMLLQPANSTLNVRQFGAVGDGTSEDWEAIQAAIDAVATGGTIHIPEGVYSFGTAAGNRVVIGKSIKVICDKGAVLDKNTTDGSILNVDDCSNVEWHGGLLDHDRSATGNNAVNIRGCQKVKFVGTQFNNAAKDCVFLGSSITAPQVNINTNIFFDRCEFLNGRRQGVSIIEGIGVFFSNCIFRGIQGDAPEAGADIESNSLAELTEHIYFNNCVFDGIPNNAGVFNATGRFVSVLGCQFKDTAFGVLVAAVLANTNQIDVVSFDSITDQIEITAHGLSVNDTLTLTNTGDGTLPAGLSTGIAYRVGTVVDANNITLSIYVNNGVPVSFTDNGSLPCQVNKYLQSRSANTTVVGCHFQDQTSSAIYGEVGYDYIIEDNTIVGCQSGNAAIALNNIDRAAVSGNTVRASTDGEGIYCSGKHGQIFNNTITGNSNTDEGIRYYGGYASRIDGNTLIDCGNVPNVAMQIRYFDDGSVCDNIIKDESALNPAYAIRFHDDDFTGNTVDGNNCKNSCASDGGSFFELNEDNATGRLNTMNSGLPFNFHLKASNGALNDITNQINTTGKYEGKMQYNTTLSSPVYASGPAAGDVWRFASGSVANTPV